jgi:hypothetical protein
MNNLSRIAIIALFIFLFWKVCYLSPICSIWFAVVAESIISHGIEHYKQKYATRNN